MIKRKNLRIEILRFFVHEQFSEQKKKTNTLNIPLLNNKYK